MAYDAVSGSQLWVARAGRKSGLDSAADVKVAPGGASLFVTGSLMWRNGAGTDYATIAYVP